MNQIQNISIFQNNKTISSSLKALIGIVKLPDDFNEKKELFYYFENKHLK